VALLTHFLRIPFERALDFANKEKITELLYPLFVHNIGALLYHPTNQTRTNAVMAAAERRKQEQNQLRNTQAPAGLPSLHQHHHHSMNNSISGPLPGPQHSLAPHPSVGRPGIDRAHTFPTPPTSASSVLGNMGSSDGSFQWGPQGGMGSAQGTNPLSIDTGLSNARSMPTTPATTPPGASIQSMQQYQQQGSQPYDASRQMYSAPPSQQNAYPQSTVGQDNMRYSQPNSYIKNEMGPPSARATGTEAEHHDPKNGNGMLHHNQGQGQVSHGQEDEADHEHEAEYTHDNSGSYDANRGQYNYSSGPAVGSLTGEHPHLSPEMTGSPSHPASGRATPRTAAAPQPYYAQQQGGYSTPPRVQPPSSNLYNVMSSERGTANGSTSGDVYGSQSDLGNSLSNGYPSQQPVMNGAPTGNKRGRDDEDDGRPSSRGPGGVADADSLKRRKTIREGSISGPSYGADAPLNRARATITQRRR
jgi:protein SOK2